MSIEIADSSEQPVAWIDYDYAIVRVVPRVDLGAFMNVGIVLHARTAKFLDAMLHADSEKLMLSGHALDTDLLHRCIDAYGRVCRGGANGGPIGMLPPSERFHWLTSPRSAVIQTSAVHPGRCRDPRTALEDLFRHHCAI